MWAYATLALGSAMALFTYPHSVTATLSSDSRTTIRRNASILPAYSFVLGLLALLGWVAIAAYKIINPITGKHFGGSLAEIPGLGDMGYVALTAFVINLVITVAGSFALNAAKVPNGSDETTAGDYFADAGDPRVEKDKAVSEQTGDQAGAGGTIIE